MPIEHAKAALLKLQDAYYQESQNSLTYSPTKSALTKLKAAFAEALKTVADSVDVALLKAEYQLLLFRYEGYTIRDLIATKAELERAFIAVPVAPPASKWEEILISSKEALMALSTESANHARATQNIKKENVLRLLNNLIQKEQEKERDKQQDAFDHMQKAFYETKIDLQGFLNALIFFYKQTQWQLQSEKIKKAPLEFYGDCLLEQVNLLTQEELRWYYKQMHCPEIISLCNAFFVPRFLHEGNEDERAEVIGDFLCDDLADRFSSVRKKTAKATERPLNNEEKRAHFLLLGRTIHQVLLTFHSALASKLDVKSEEPSPLHVLYWPKSGVSMNAAQKKIMLNSAELMDDTSKKEQFFSVYTPDTGKEKSSAEQLNTSFAHIMSSLGYFFNPNRFSDALSVLSANHIKTTISAMNDEQMNALDQLLRGEDVNQLLMILRHIKEASQEEMKTVCSWLSIKRSESGGFNEQFKTLAQELYDKADFLMQTVRLQKELKDYPYKDLEKKATDMYSIKNAACLKRMLSIHAEERIDKKFQFKYTLPEKCYLYLYQGMPEVGSKVRTETGVKTSSNYDRLTRSLSEISLEPV